MEYVASQAHYGKLACKRLLLYKLEVEVPKIFFQSFMYPKKQQPISAELFFSNKSQTFINFRKYSIK